MSLQGKEVTIVVDDIQPTSKVRKPGDRGTFVIPFWVAVGLGLVQLPMKPPPKALG